MVFSGIEHKSIDTVLPLAEVIMCIGFFSICILEELLHHCLHPHKTTDKQKDRNIKKADTIADTSFNDAEKYQAEEKMKNLEDDESEEESEEERSTAEKTKSAIRTFFVVSALSFHR